METLYSTASEITIDDSNSSEYVDENTPLMTTESISNPELDSTIKDPIKDLRKVVKLFNKSAKLSDSLRQVTPLKMQLDVKTRWNSLLTMISSYLKIKDHVKATLVKNQLDCNLTQSHDRYFEELEELLKPIETAVLKLSQKDCNLVTADILLSTMIKDVTKCKDSSLKKLLKSNLIKRVNERRTTTSDILFYFCKSDYATDDNIFYTEPSLPQLIELVKSLEPKNDQVHLDEPVPSKFLIFIAVFSRVLFKNKSFL